MVRSQINPFASQVRDDLQSAKQMLALELRNKETLERENKKMAAKVAALEAELEKEKQMRQQDAGTKIVKMRTDEDEAVREESGRMRLKKNLIAGGLEKKIWTQA